MRKSMNLTRLCLALFVFGCATGKEPPVPTSMVSISGTSGAIEFNFGTETMCCYGGLNGCDNGTTPASSAICELDRPRPLYPSMMVKIPAFEIDEHEVTNLQYQHCVARGGCSEPAAVNALGGGKYDKYYDEDSDDFANFPVVRVTYKQAEEYCQFVGKRLPTEFEWEAAIQKASTPFVWGSEPSGCQGDNKVAIEACNTDYGFPQPVKGAMTTDEIVTDGGVLYGMAGNVSEWTSTIYAADLTCVAGIDAFNDESTGTARACRSSFELCADQSSDGNFKNCAAQMRQCTECLYPREDAAAMTNDECFGMCTEVVNPDSDGNGTALRQNTHWVCRKQALGDVFDDPQGPSTGANRVIRGANYKTSDLCEARPRWRLDRFQDQTSASPTLGFRCARSL